MLLAFIVANELSMPGVMALLKRAEIDYYTRWDHAIGKGHGTDPHLGVGSFGSTNSVLMIAFEDERPLRTLIAHIRSFNDSAARSDERVRVFEVPLNAIV